MVSNDHKPTADQSFDDFIREAKQDPEVAAYLDSFSVFVGKLVLDRRLKIGWSQAELAKQAKTIQARISQVEAGFETIKSGTLNRIFKVLGLSSIHFEYHEDAAARELAMA